MLSLRNRHFFLIDLILLPAIAVLAFVLRLDAVRVQAHGNHMLLFILVTVPTKLIIIRVFGLYSRYWRYASMEELVTIVTAVGASTVVSSGILFALALPLSRLAGFPRSIPLIDGLLTLLAVGGPRFAVRWMEQRRQRGQRQQSGRPEKRVLIMGAGDAGAMIVKEMRANPQLGLDPVGFVDDEKRKANVKIHGVPVLGAREDIRKVVKDYGVSEIIIAMPAASGSVIREIVGICGEAGVAARTMPGLNDILSGEVSVNQLREVDIKDLLRREVVQTDAAAVEQMLRGRRVLVTGGGGSIGSELCRQILRAGPKSLVLLGHGENSLFTVQGELSQLIQGRKAQLEVVLADIRDKGRLASIFSRCQPEFVFHAAAHKHVPLMEANPCEAVTNNVLGTRNLIELAEDHRVEDFVLISTDKAVNPTSIMGCSKRVAELLVYQAAQRTGRCFAAVRFGNVLGSRGSVVNIFKRQIAQGGPVTVTHPEMKRYFMTIPEAVQLVLQAATMSQGGEVFVLDMGEPVRIVDLAADLIRLSGLRPYVEGDDEDGDWDIKVVFTGVRPGEKLFEELFVEDEGYGRTQHEKIFVAMNGRRGGEEGGELNSRVDRLIELAQAGEAAQVRQLLREIVPEYCNQHTATHG